MSEVKHDEKQRRINACLNAFEGIPTDRIEGKDIGQILAGELKLHHAGPRHDGGFGFELSGGACQLLAEAYADQFRQSGAINYLELLFEHSDIGPLTITMQRVEGMTPAQKLAKAEEERDALAAENLALKSAIECHMAGFSVCEACGEDNTCGNDDVGIVLKETPATDAYVSQLRAKGIPEQLKEIGELIRTQDNRITDQPMFVVFEKREIIGSDEHSPSRIAWVCESEEVDELRGKRLELLYQNGRDTDGYDRYAMQEIDVFVTACFTENGCKEYLRKNGHNLRHPYIYAAGSYRNDEYQAVRKWLESLPEAFAANLRKENGND